MTASTARPKAITADALYAEVLRHARAELARPPTDTRLARAAAAAKSVAERAWALVRPSVEKKGILACAAGCAWCCYEGAAILPGEVPAIRAYVESNYDAGTRAGLEARLADTDARTRGLDPAERARAALPCPFLDEHARCGIYPVRPFRCRGRVSRNVDFCRRKLENPELSHGNPRVLEILPREPVAIMDVAMHGFAAACAEIGLPARALDLTAALRLALSAETAGERIAADPAFLDAAAVKPLKEEPTRN